MLPNLREEFNKYAATEEAYTATYVSNTQDRICQALKDQKISNGALARSLGVRKQSITQYLVAENLTFKTVGRIAFALGLKAITSFAPKDMNQVFFRELVDSINENANDMDFYAYVKRYKPK